LDQQRYQIVRQRRDVLIMIVLALVSVVLARVPYFALLLFPFHLFGTFVHELGHGFAAIITGGTFHRLVVFPDLSGMAWSSGGVRWFITSAGYLGSALFGAVLAVLSARRISARRLLVGLGVALAILCLFFVRNLFGIVAGLLVAAALCIAGRKLPQRWANGFVLFLAVQMMLNALDSLMDLTLVSASVPATASDAQIMAQATGVPAVVWAVLWSLAGIGILLTALRIAYSRPTHTVVQNLPDGRCSTVTG
jgi:hypothetical protein